MEKSGLFCIASPLQALCAVEAIQEYGINVVKVIVISDNLRTNQTLLILDKHNIPYSIKEYRGGFFHSILQMLYSMIPFVGRYDFLFMGNFFSFSLKMLCLPYLKNGGELIYLDDGSSTLSLANGSFNCSKLMLLRSRWCSVITRLRRISDLNFYTIFADDIHKEEWSVKKNELNHLLKNRSVDINNRNGYILIIGTVIDVYCDYLGLEMSVFFDKFQNLVENIKIEYKDNKIVYIPHGRDRSPEIKLLCEKLEVEYLKTDDCIEVFTINNNEYPLCIYGFSSTALKTLHIIFSEAKAFNMLILDGRNKPQTNEYISIAESYERDGIKRIVL